MLKKLLSTAVAAALLVSAATIALEALGVFFQARSDDSERRIMEAFIARIEARFDPASPVEPTWPMDLPATADAERLGWTAGRPAAPVGPEKAATAAAVATLAPQSELRRETGKATTAAGAKAAPSPAASASPASEATAERKPIQVVSRKPALAPAAPRAAAPPVAPEARRETKEPVQVQDVP